MGYSIQGRVLDSDLKIFKPIEFALIYTSDKGGKPITPSKNTQTDEKGFWKLNDLNDTDFITVRNLGYQMKTFLAKDVPNVSLNEYLPPQRNILTYLKPDDNFNLDEIKIEADREFPKIVVTENQIKINTPKTNYGVYIVVGGLLLIATAFILNKQTQ